MEDHVNQETQITEDDQSTHPVCSVCGNGKLHNLEVHSAIWHNDKLVVVEDIPALVCDMCHERYFDDTTVLMLDLMRADGFRNDAADRELNVPVFSYRDRTPETGNSG